jgi:hypothetical protein
MDPITSPPAAPRPAPQIVAPSATRRRTAVVTFSAVMLSLLLAGLPFAQTGAPPADALTAFEATLEKEPNRFRTLSGAAKSASLAGNRQKARAHSALLLKICERADNPERPELREARRLVQRRP